MRDIDSSGDIRLIAALGVVVVGVIYRLPVLVSPLWCAAVLALCLWRFPGRGLVACLAVMAAWTLVDAQSRMANRWPVARDGAVAELRGRVAALPEIQHRRTRFRLAADDGRTYRLSWYDDAPRLAAGDCLNLRAKISTPHGSANPGGFDYTAWLWREGIDATGYVKQDLGCADAPRASLDRLRGAAIARLAPTLSGRPMRGIIEALSLGVRQHIDDAQWAVLRATGTTHLVAISGLHIGLVAGLLFFLARWGLLRSPARRRARLAACGIAFLGAAGYAALAGWALPTQRALVMVTVGLIAVALEREIGASKALGAAAIAVLLISPPAVTAPGFWLSFAAVAWLIALAGWIRGPWWARWIGYQAGLVVALMPITLWFFGQASLVSPLVNGLLIPAASVFVPVVLLGVLLALVVPSLGGEVLTWVGTALNAGWQVLAWVAQVDMAAMATVLASITLLLLAVGGLVWLMLPLPPALRGLGLVCLLPIALGVRPGLGPPAPGAFRTHVLDVGQGLAVVVRSANHVLVFDAGPAYPSGFDAGEMIVTPFLGYLGISHINRLMISHGDMDHIGGARALSKAFSIGRRVGAESAHPCHAGQTWAWDGVRFTVLAPTAADAGRAGNDASCVLRVASADYSILLTGDIERRGEQALVERLAGADLASDVLVVPHHGSNTSSSARFLDAVAPRAAIVSSGWHNRWGFPRPQVVARYRARGVTLFNTAVAGAVTLEAAADTLQIRRFRDDASRFWQTP
ncbi:DNA internalization-related competence protein ComEC/Rec2 [uncultured Salinisphaera sp.]|uniref:DNA internalization-related competence protein ComEC/Rec2 n=1 Tax=uncultured Salinisphaera sp. TaxID=359372 RepID=UPI0032B10196|tara:strand:+ start:3115 stop:5358 length:2244 start_codon:yes stop_codon:yes gene_type:complete